MLDLLTGHTLYNDPSVCIRELVQNSIDAVRLQHFDQDRTRARKEAEIEIRWNSDSRELTVKDNGTGMSQEIIENHLLRVGASRYQDPKFKEDNSDFSPISRFGIGVLSAFMLPDDVEITTRYAPEDVARRLLLRSVHGKYLIRILDPATDPVAAEVTPHGTLFRLFVRPSAVVQDVKSITERWIMFPDSKVSLFIDGEEPVCIGHKSPKFALENAFKQLLQMDDSHKTTLATEKVRFVERELDGVSVAYALIWPETFGVWSFVDSAVLNVRDNDNVIDFLATCVEGVRVDSGTPGFEEATIFAISNSHGKRAPRTNVARTGLETTPETEDMIKALFDGYVQHITEEIGTLQVDRGYSATWARVRRGICRNPFSISLAAGEGIIGARLHVKVRLLAKGRCLA